jgi:hypothetical protein
VPASAAGFRDLLPWLVTRFDFHLWLLRPSSMKRRINSACFNPFLLATFASSLTCSSDSQIVVRFMELSRKSMPRRHTSRRVKSVGYRPSIIVLILLVLVYV